MSTLKVDTLQTTGGAGLYPARAWVNFDGKGTVAILGDGNVSSITDLGTGQYTANFTSNMTNANFSAVTSCGLFSTLPNQYANIYSTTSSSVRIWVGTPNSGNAYDVDNVYLNVTS
jgi:hypothetical protein